MNRAWKFWAAGVSLLTMVAAPAALAATATGTLTVTATVNAVCVINNATLAFGVYDPVGVNAAGSPLLGTATFTVACTRGTGYNVYMNTGQYGAGAGAYGGTRRMQAAVGEFLEYELYSDAGRTSVWTALSGQSGSATNINPITHTVYGRAFAAQDVTTGNYSDSVTMTVNF